jgi:hypothetical protein
VRQLVEEASKKNEQAQIQVKGYKTKEGGAFGIV